MGFSIQLSPLKAGSELSSIALDLYPLQVIDQVQQNVHVKLAPSLKFVNQVEGTLGEASFEILYEKLLPFITAQGLQDNLFSWDIERTPHYPLFGTRAFYA